MVWSSIVTKRCISTTRPFTTILSNACPSRVLFKPNSNWSPRISLTQSFTTRSHSSSSDGNPTTHNHKVNSTSPSNEKKEHTSFLPRKKTRKHFPPISSSVSSDKVPTRRRTAVRQPKPPTPLLASASMHPHATEAKLYGVEAADAISFLRSNPHVSPHQPQYSIDSILRGADYLTSALGTTEDLVGRRRALMELDDPQHGGGGAAADSFNRANRKKWEEDIEKLIREEEESEFSDLDDYATEREDLKLSEEDMSKDIWFRQEDYENRTTSNTHATSVSASASSKHRPVSSATGKDGRATDPLSSGNKDDWMMSVDEIGQDEDAGAGIDSNETHPNQKAFGPWSDMTVRVDRVVKVQRGGKMVRYRALVIGGNLNGCAGFGIAKAAAPNEAAAAAARMCKRNIFFIDRTMGSGLTYDLAGRHNSCRVLLRSVRPQRGLKGHPLILEILKFFGVTDCSAKSHGNRNIYNVVQATFKAILTHESMEDVALKRGKRLLNIERARRLQI